MGEEGKKEGKEIKRKEKERKEVTYFIPLKGSTASYLVQNHLKHRAISKT